MSEHLANANARLRALVTQILKETDPWRMKRYVGNFGAFWRSAKVLIASKAHQRKCVTRPPDLNALVKLRTGGLV